MIDVPCCVLILPVDTIWYIVSCVRSLHFSVTLVELALKSSNVGNAGAGSLKWSAKSDRTSPMLAAFSC